MFVFIKHHKKRVKTSRFNVLHKHQIFMNHNMKRELLLYNYKENKKNSAKIWIDFLGQNNGKIFKHQGYYAPDRPSLGKIQNYTTKKINKDREINILLQQSRKCTNIFNNQQHCITSLV